MSSEESNSCTIPDGFPEILKTFTREVLRHQNEIVTASEIYSFATKYFQKLINERDGIEKNPEIESVNLLENIPKYMDMNDEDIEKYVLQIFQNADKNKNGYLDRKEFMDIFNNLKKFLCLSKREVLTLLVEADESEDGTIDYREFSPIAIDIIQSLRQNYVAEQKQIEREVTAVDKGVEYLLHGMSEEEFRSTLTEIFNRSDVDGNGYLNSVEFSNCLQDSNLGLTRKEINLMMATADRNNDGRISYEEFIPLVMELIFISNSYKLFDIPEEEEELSDFLICICQNNDEEKSGIISLKLLKESIREAGLGLSRIQIAAILGNVDIIDGNKVNYSQNILNISTRIITLLKSQRIQEKVKFLIEYRKTTESHLILGLNRYEFEETLMTTCRQIDSSEKGVLSFNEIDTAFHSAFPTITKRQFGVICSIIEDYTIAPDSYSYIDIVKESFQLLQNLQEQTLLYNL